MNRDAMMRNCKAGIFFALFFALLLCSGAKVFIAQNLSAEAEEGGLTSPTLIYETIDGNSCRLKGISAGDLSEYNVSGVRFKITVPAQYGGRLVTEIGAAAFDLYDYPNTAVAQIDFSGAVNLVKIGHHAFTQSGADASNYTVTQPTGITVNITKAEGSGSVTIEGWKRGEAANSPVPVSATNGTGSVTYEYKAKGADDSEYSATVPTKAGEYTVKATFAATGNYNGFTTTADFIIEKSGLSGGAIAGIVVGSVAVAGIGGFAIFWFVIKKKSFADLFGKK